MEEGFETKTLTTAVSVEYVPDVEVSFVVTPASTPEPVIEEEEEEEEKEEEVEEVVEEVEEVVAFDIFAWKPPVRKKKRKR